MDNLTHGLVGVALAECAYHLSPASRADSGPKLRRALWLVAIVGNNLPDLDILYAPFLLGGKLGYLLHHRGHTHTVPFALVLGWLSGIAAHLWWGVGRKARGPGVGLLWFVALASPLLHLFMDWMNHYGVHPFWPAWKGWVYGDTLFIIEPLLWLSLLPLLHNNVSSKRLRWAVEVLVAALLTAMALLPLAKWYSVVVAGALALYFGTFGRRLRAAKLAAVCTGLACVVVLVFFAASRWTRHKVLQDAQGIFAATQVHDVVLSPFPANPLCWMVITVETYDDGKRYRLRRGVVAPFPSLTKAAHCPSRPTRGSTAYLSPVPELWGPEYEWEGKYHALVSELAAYKQLSCAWDGMLRFSRAPFLQEEAGTLWAGDLRFDFEPEAGFAELEAGEQAPPCEGWIPDWIPPTRAIF